MKSLWIQLGPNANDKILKRVEVGGEDTEEKAMEDHMKMEAEIGAKLPK